MWFISYGKFQVRVGYRTVWWYMYDYDISKYHTIIIVRNTITIYMALLCFNPQRAGTELIRFIIVSIIVADALASCIARISTPMILTK